MDAITVTWNGPLHQQSVTETPDDTMTVGEYCDALVASHAIPGEHGYELTWDGEPVPDTLEVSALSGAALFVHALAAKVKAAPKKGTRK